jgi:thiol-disulfide isomerase/thioredoxin
MYGAAKLLVFILSIFTSTSSCREGASNQSSGGGKQPFPSLEVVDLTNKTVNLKDYAKGKTKVISFWATWCGPCKRELNSYNKSFERWRKEFNAELVAVSVDEGKSPENLAGFVSSYGWNFKVLYDKAQRSMPQFNIQGIPFLIVVDKNGNIVKTQTGYDSDEGKLEKLLASLK